MKSSEFIFNDSGDEDNTYNEKYLQQNEPANVFPEVHELIEFGGFEEASRLLNDAYLSHMAMYGADYVMGGLLNVVSSVMITSEEKNTCYMRGGNTRTLCIPHRVAHTMTCDQDILFYVLFERCRSIADRIGPVILQKLGYAKSDILPIYRLAVDCWGSALSRCYTSSIMPERMFSSSENPQHLFLHGLHVEVASKALRESGKTNVAQVYTALYNMQGQEPYHLNLGRLPPTNQSNIDLNVVVEAFINDFYNKPNPEEEESDNNTGDGQEEGNAGAKPYESVFVGDEESDERLEEAVAGVQEEQANLQNQSSRAEVIALPNFDVDDKLDSYLSFVMQTDTRYASKFEQFNTVQFRDNLTLVNHMSVVESMKRNTTLMTMEPIPSAQLTFDDYSMVAQGYTPTLFQVPVEPSVQSRAKYALTMDVSGSMISWWPFTQSMIRVMKPYIEDDSVFMFSEQQHQMRENVPALITTGGTDINKALAELHDKGFSKVVIVTDMECYDVEPIHFDHLIVVATFEDKRSYGYKKYTRSGREDVNDTCFKNVSGNVEIQCVFLQDLVS